MVRGRKKDLSIPLTRTLAQQRDYRARRVRYIEHLEERCRVAEQECQKLREELATVKSAKLIDAHPQIAQASSHLLQTLTSASSALMRFQEVMGVSIDDSESPSAQPLRSDDSSLAQAPSPPLYRSNPSLSQPSLQIHSTLHTHNRRTSKELNESSSQTQLSQCCGGLLDCRDPLAREAEGDYLADESDITSEYGPGPDNMSSLRSTQTTRS